MIDGNSFWTTEPNRIRLASVYGPEEGKPGYEETKNTLKRLIQKKILDGFSVAILEGKIAQGMHVEIDIEGHNLAFHPSRNKNEQPVN